MVIAARKHLRTIATNPYLNRFIRLGYFIRGILYGAIGCFILADILHLAQESTTQLNVLNVISHIWFGSVFLIIFIVGLMSYSIWGFIRAFLDLIDKRNQAIPLPKRIGYLISGIFYGSLVNPIISLLEHKKTIPSTTLRTFSHTLITIPFGQWILGLLAVIGCIGSCMEIRKAVVARDPSSFYYQAEEVMFPKFFMVISRIAISTRGLVWLAISLFLLFAAYEANPNQTKSMNDIFVSLQSFMLGTEIVAILAFGFVLFGLYSMSLALWVSLPEEKKER